MRPIIAGYDTSLIRITDIQFKLGKPGSVLGCDFSGIVVKVGKNAGSTRRVDEYVSAFVHGGVWADEGAFAEYARTRAELVWPVPPNTLSPEEASTISCG